MSGAYGRIVAALAGLALPGALAAAAALAQSPPAAHFAGTASLEGRPAPAGARVAALMGGAECASAALTGLGSPGAYSIRVPRCGAGAVVSFAIDGRPAAQTGVWTSGALVRLDLSADGPPAAVTPTPAPDPAVTPTPTPAPTRTAVVAHRIAAGDTLLALALAYGVTVAAIVELNPGIDPTGLQIGDTVRIPPNAPGAVAPAPTPTPEPTATPEPTRAPEPTATPEPTPTRTAIVAHRIAAGDTLLALALAYGVTVAAIVELNPGIDPTGLQIGDTVRIPPNASPTPTPTPEPTPTPTPAPATVIAHRIEADDTLWGLALRYGTSVAAIMALNPGLDPAGLQIGDVVRVPASASAATPTPAPGATATLADVLTRATGEEYVVWRGPPAAVAEAVGRTRVNAIHQWVAREQRWRAWFPGAEGLGVNEIATLAPGVIYLVQLAGP